MDPCSLALLSRPKACPFPTMLMVNFSARPVRLMVGIGMQMWGAVWRECNANEP